MRLLTRSYWTPVIVALLLVTLVGFWTWQALRSFEEMHQDRRRRFALGVFDTVQATLRALGRHGRFRRDEVEDVLKSMVGHSPLRFVAIEQGGRRILEVGEAPKGIPLPASGDSGEILGEDVAVFWQPVQLRDAPQGSETSPIPNPSEDLQLDASGQVLILGIGPPSGVRAQPRPPNEEILLPPIVVLLFVGASTVAWIMTVRSGLLAEQLEAERARRAHLEELSLAAAGLAHETKNPLGIILGLAQRISANPKAPADSRAMAEHIVDEVDKATSRVGGFLTFARQRTAVLAPVDVSKLSARVAQVIRPDFDSAGVALAMDCAPVSVFADEEMLSQILVNLLLNSLHASSAGATVTVRWTAQGKSARLSVEDQGGGIAPDLLPNIFKPYVSGHAGGHGLGLPVVKRFVEQHGWTIRVDSEVGRGTTVVIAGIRTAEGESEP